MKRVIVFQITAWLMLLFSCRAPQDTKFNRFHHSFTGEFNIIYNAKEAERYMLEDMLKRHREVFSVPIPILPKFSEKNIIAEQGALVQFQEKADKIIQNKYLGNRMGDAYLFLAKANYYADKKIVAEEFINYVSKNYSTPERINLLSENAVWKARILMDDKKYSYAQKYIDSILVIIGKKNNRWKNELLALRSQILFNTNKKEEALDLLADVFKNNKHKSHKQRWALLISQWCDSLGRPDEQRLFNQKAASLNAHRDIKLYAKIRTILLNEALTIDEKKMEVSKYLSDERYLSLQDIVYENLAEVDFLANDNQQGISNLLKAALISTNKANKHKLYLRVADLLYFEEKEYAKSKKYYDFCLQYLPESDEHFSSLKRKSDKLVEIAKYDDIIKYQDTLLMLSDMSEERRISYLDSVYRANDQSERRDKIELLKITQRKDEEEKKASKNVFYFYNDKVRQDGYYNFIEIWGEIQNADNWRLGSQEQTFVKFESQEEKEEVAVVDNRVVKIMDDVPKTKAQKDNARYIIASTLYKMAQAFMLVIEDYENAIDAFEKLISKYSFYGDKGELNYTLYDLSLKTDDFLKAEYYKDVILTQFGHSIYAQAVQNDGYESREERLKNRIEQAFKSIKKDFDEKRYEAVIDACNQWIRLYGINKDISLSVYYIRALAVGYTSSPEAFEEKLREIISLFSKNNIATSMINKQLEYIEKNREHFYSRTYALENFDENSVHAPYFSLTTYKSEYLPKEEEVKENLSTVIANKKIRLEEEAMYYHITFLEVKKNLNFARRELRKFNSRYFGRKGLRLFTSRKSNVEIVGSREFGNRADALDYYKKIDSSIKDIFDAQKKNIRHCIIPKEVFESMDKIEDIKNYAEHFLDLIPSDSK